MFNLNHVRFILLNLSSTIYCRYYCLSGPYITLGTPLQISYLPINLKVLTSPVYPSNYLYYRQFRPTSINARNSTFTTSLYSLSFSASIHAKVCSLGFFRMFSIQLNSSYFLYLLQAFNSVGPLTILGFFTATFGTLIWSIPGWGPKTSFLVNMGLSSFNWGLFNVGDVLQKVTSPSLLSQVCLSLPSQTLFNYFFNYYVFNLSSFNTYVNLPNNPGLLRLLPILYSQVVLDGSSGVLLVRLEGSYASSISLFNWESFSLYGWKYIT